MVCTSPPYWGLRDYGRDGQIGLEQTPEEFVASLVEVFRGVRRVLRSDGTLWVNLGDSYAGSMKGSFKSDEAWDSFQDRAKDSGYTPGVRARTHYDRNSMTPPGLKPKDLVGIPWRVAFALQADGWYLRSAIPWIKPNCMPSSQTDRPTTGTEYVFLFAHPDSGGRYFYDMEATRVAPVTKPQRRHTPRREHSKGAAPPPGASLRPPNYETSAEPTVACTPAAGRNRRDTDWFMDSLQHILDGGQGLIHNEDGTPLGIKVNPKPYSGAHFAVWPPALVLPMIRAGTSEYGVCKDCGAPWARETQDTWEPTCMCPARAVTRATVLDPFSGSATTGMVATQEGRSYVGIDLNEDYLELAKARVQDLPAPSKEAKEAEQVDELDFFGE